MLEPLKAAVAAKAEAALACSGVDRIQRVQRPRAGGEVTFDLVVIAEDSAGQVAKARPRPDAAYGLAEQALHAAMLSQLQPGLSTTLTAEAQKQYDSLCAATRVLADIISQEVLAHSAAEAARLPVVWRVAAPPPLSVGAAAATPAGGTETQAAPSGAAANSGRPGVLPGTTVAELLEGEGGADTFNTQLPSLDSPRDLGGLSGLEFALATQAQQAPGQAAQGDGGTAAQGQATQGPQAMGTTAPQPHLPIQPLDPSAGLQTMLAAAVSGAGTSHGGAGSSGDGAPLPFGVIPVLGGAATWPGPGTDMGGGQNAHGLGAAGLSLQLQAAATAAAAVVAGGGAAAGGSGAGDGANELTLGLFLQQLAAMVGGLNTAAATAGMEGIAAVAGGGNPGQDGTAGGMGGVAGGVAGGGGGLPGGGGGGRALSLHELLGPLPTGAVDKPAAMAAAVPGATAGTATAAAAPAPAGRGGGATAAAAPAPAKPSTYEQYRAELARMAQESLPLNISASYERILERAVQGEREAHRPPKSIPLAEQLQMQVDYKYQNAEYYRRGKLLQEDMQKLTLIHPDVELVAFLHSGRSAKRKIIFLGPYSFGVDGQLRTALADLITMAQRQPAMRERITSLISQVQKEEQAMLRQRKREKLRAAVRMPAQPEPAAAPAAIGVRRSVDDDDWLGGDDPDDVAFGGACGDEGGRDGEGDGWEDDGGYMHATEQQQQQQYTLPELTAGMPPGAAGQAPAQQQQRQQGHMAHTGAGAGLAPGPTAEGAAGMPPGPAGQAPAQQQQQRQQGHMAHTGAGAGLAPGPTAEGAAGMPPGAAGQAPAQQQQQQQGHMAHTAAGAPGPTAVGAAGMPLGAAELAPAQQQGPSAHTAVATAAPVPVRAAAAASTAGAADVPAGGRRNKGTGVKRAAADGAEPKAKSLKVPRGTIPALQQFMRTSIKRLLPTLPKPYHVAKWRVENPAPSLVTNAHLESAFRAAAKDVEVEMGEVTYVGQGTMPVQSWVQLEAEFAGVFEAEMWDAGAAGATMHKFQELALRGYKENPWMWERFCKIELLIDNRNRLWA